MKIPANTVRRILVPVDDSGPSRRAIRRAAALARQLKARVTLLHVITPFESQHYGRRLPAVVTVIEFRKCARRSADRMLARAKRGVGAIPCDALAVWHHSAARAIVAAARSGRHDLVVMGSHGHGALGRALLGGVAQKVLTRSRVPVMICR